MRLSVIGCGYLGAVHAAAMASIGHEVVGIDVDQRKIEALADGKAPFFEPGLPELLKEGVASGRLRFTTDMAEAAGASVHFIGVGTPQQKDGYAADLTYVNAAVDELIPYLKPGDIVAGKSTVPVGTAASLAERVNPTGATLVWNPEFLREGWAVQDTIAPDRLVAGVPSGDEGTRAARHPSRGVSHRDRDGHALHHHGLRDRRAGEGRRQRLPRHEDLVHQRDGRDRRGDRRRCH